MRVFTVLQAELLDPAVNGTLNVLCSCKKASNKRVIMSSKAGVAYNGKPRTPDVVVDETWFSSAEICAEESGNLPLCASPAHRTLVVFHTWSSKTLDWLFFIYGVAGALINTPSVRKYLS